MSKMQEIVKRLFGPIILVLTATLAFGLGRLSKIEDTREPLSIEYAPSTPDSSKMLSREGSALLDKPEGKYIASKNGGSYHYPWCSGAKRIISANAIWFNSTDEAKRAGYKPAANCPGL